MRSASALPRPWHATASVTTLLVASAVAVAAGLASGAGYGIQALAVVAVAVAVVVGLVNWRYSIFGLLIYLPFSGIPIIASHPNTTIAVLLKDVLFVIPAYLGFLARRGSERSSLIPDHGLAVLLTLLVMLVLGQALNPSLPNYLVAIIGIKVWLFYVPLLALGYHLVSHRQDLDRVLRLISIAAIVPAALGLVEAILIYSGRAPVVYGWYGDAASVVTQEFAELTFEDGGALRRVPSSFSFVAQYFAFTVAMTAATYAWWRGALAGTRWSIVGGALWALMLLAGMLSGARAAFFFIPLLVALMLTLDRQGVRLPPGRLVAVVVALFLAVGLLGARLGSLLGGVMEVGAEHLNIVLLEGFRDAFAITTAGLGTGIDTNASRYAFSGITPFQGVGGVWYESWFVKVLLELGIGGLVLVGLIFGALIIGAVARHRRLRDLKLRAISAALLAVLIWNFVYCVKGQYLDIDPMNVYFWLFAGMLLAIPRLDRATPPRPEPAHDDA